MCSILITKLSRAADQKSCEKKGLKISTYNNKITFYCSLSIHFVILWLNPRVHVHQVFNLSPLTNSSRNVLKGIADSHRDTSTVVVETEYLVSWESPLNWENWQHYRFPSKSEFNETDMILCTKISLGLLLHWDFFQPKAHASFLVLCHNINRCIDVSLSFVN